MAPYKAAMGGAEEVEEETSSGDLIAMNRSARDVKLVKGGRGMGPNLNCSTCHLLQIGC